MGYMGGNWVNPSIIDVINSSITDGAEIVFVFHFCNSLSDLSNRLDWIVNKFDF